MANETVLGAKGDTGATGAAGAAGAGAAGAGAAKGDTGAAGAAGAGPAAGAAGTAGTGAAAGAAAPGAATTVPGDQQSGAAKAIEPAPADIQIKIPEGVAVDQGLLKTFTEFAKEHKIAPEAAQKFADSYMGSAKKATEEATLRQAEQIVSWAEEARADKEIGGANWDKNVAAANKAMQRFGSKDLVALMNQSGLGNHKEMIRFFSKIGKSISEDTIPGGAAGQGGEGGFDLDVMYPSMAKKT